MWSKMKALLDSTHLVAILAGMLIAAGVAWGTGNQKLTDHEKRITVVENLLEKKIADAEALRRQEQREFREEIAKRFDRIENRLDRTTR
jgi:hypothetical protein